MVTDAASQARPLAATEVIRRGNRRRARAIGQRSLGGLSLLGVGAAAIFLGGTAHNPAANPAASTTSGLLTTTATSSSSAGTMTVTVRYRDEPHSKIELLAFSYSGHARAAMTHAALSITLGPSLTPLIGHSGSGKQLLTSIATVLRLTGSHDFAGSLSRHVLDVIGQHHGLTGDEAIRVVLGKARRARNGWTVIDPKTRVLTPVGLILTR